MALVCKKHKRPEGQQVAHILTLKLYQATTLSFCVCSNIDSFSALPVCINNDEILQVK